MNFLRRGKCFLHLCCLLDVHRVTVDCPDILSPVLLSSSLRDVGSVSHLLPYLGIPPSLLTLDLSCQFPRSVVFSSCLSLVRVKAIVVFIRHWGHND